MIIDSQFLQELDLARTIAPPVNGRSPARWLEAQGYDPLLLTIDLLALTALALAPVWAPWAIERAFIGLMNL